jgi:hypothetical protein
MIVSFRPRLIQKFLDSRDCFGAARPRLWIAGLLDHVDNEQSVCFDVDRHRLERGRRRRFRVRPLVNDVSGDCW